MNLSSPTTNYKFLIILYFFKKKKVNCTLRVIDTEISIAERVECWKKYAPQPRTLRGSKKPPTIDDPFSKFRYDIIKFLRFPPGLFIFTLNPKKKKLIINRSGAKRFQGIRSA